MARKLSLVTVGILVSAFVVQFVYADGFFIRVSGSADVSVYEPAQKAIIAWNGTVEAMILSVDVKADEKVHAMHLVPFPSNPTVKNSSFKAFEGIQRLMDSYVSHRAKRFLEELLDPWGRGVAPMRAGEPDAANAVPSLTVMFHGEIGSHNVTVVKAENSTILTQWVNSISRAHGLDSSISIETYERTLDDYIRSGLSYFALDILEVKANQTSVEPLLYEFKTSFLYFPLKISSLNPGDAAINLFLVTTAYVDESFCKPFRVGQLRLSALGFSQVEPLRFLATKSDLSNTDQTVTSMFSSCVLVTTLEWNGRTAELKNDLMIDNWKLAMSLIIRARQIMSVYLSFGGLVTFVVVGLIACGYSKNREKIAHLNIPQGLPWVTKAENPTSQKRNKQIEYEES